MPVEGLFRLEKKSARVLTSEDATRSMLSVTSYDLRDVLRFELTRRIAINIAKLPELPKRPQY